MADYRDYEWEEARAAREAERKREQAYDQRRYDLASLIRALKENPDLKDQLLQQLQ